MLAALEIQLEGELNHARVVYRPVHHAETSGCIDVLHAAAPAAQEELGMVEDVEELGPELHHHSFAE